MKAVVFAIGILVSGCASTGVYVDPDRLSAFERGVTTRAEVEAALGRPTMAQALQDGKAVLTYTYADAQIRPASFIPVVGMFAGGSDVRADSVSIFFDAQGRFESSQSTTSEYGSSVGQVRQR
jgi:outer membrane protein assembly factor BamE (lipoprotein component of BamABCDE complex)